jgi:hypothetical protein
LKHVCQLPSLEAIANDEGIALNGIQDVMRLLSIADVLLKINPEPVGDISISTLPQNKIMPKLGEYQKLR